MGRSLTTLIAGPGFGKSTLLAEWVEGVPAAWYTVDSSDSSLGAFANGLTESLKLLVPGLPADLASAAGGGSGADDPARAEALAGDLCQALEVDLRTDAVLVLDDVQEIPADSSSARLIESLCRQAPPRFHVTLASRADLPFPVQRLRGRGQVGQLSGAELALTVDEVGSMLRAVSVDPQELAEPLHRLTGGWPAAVSLASEMMRAVAVSERAVSLRALARPEGPMFAYLAEEVLRFEPPEVGDLLRVVASLERFTPELCVAVGVEHAPRTLIHLTRRGLFVERWEGDDGWIRLNPMVREFCLEHFAVPEEERREVNGRAAQWLERKGYLDDALRALERTNDPGALTTFLCARGEDLIDAGLARLVAEAAEYVPEPERPSDLLVTFGMARQALGDWDEALRLFEDAVGGSQQLPASLAWRIGSVHYLRGDPEAARTAFGRGRIQDASTPDEAQLLAWTAALHWMLGDAASCREKTELAHRAALASGDLRALASVHTTLAMLAALEGDRRSNDAHYLKALAAAERAGDLFQVVRIRTNRASKLFEEGWYEQARDELDLAIRLGEVAGFTPLLALAYSNRGWTWFHQGSLDQAASDFQHARALYEQLDSRRISYPLAGLGDVYRERGDLAMARASYEEALAQAEAAQDVQGLIPSLSGLARVLAMEDPQRAEALCEQALGYVESIARATALLAAGWVAMARQDRARATEMAQSAALVARERRDRSGLAEALELQAVAGTESPDLDLLEEAARIWADLGNELGMARVEMHLERSRSPGATEASSSAARRLAQLGVRVGIAAAGLTAAVPPSPQPANVRTLGGFALVREGRALPASDWPSKKSRDLLKLLIARRGRSVHREVLIDVLWPDEDPDGIANRLSVALSGLRSVLDTDKRFPSDHYLVAEGESLALNTGNLSVDVERFLALAKRGLSLTNTGDQDADEALSVLEAAEAMYSGDFLEEDAYQEWVIPLREEARASYVAVARVLGEAASARGDHDSAIRCYLRILERDPYDEAASLALISATLGAGGHGEARRHYGTYVARMRELDIEPAPFPASPSRIGT